MKRTWELKELKSVSTINYGYTESAAWEPIGPKFLRITDIQDDCVDWETVPCCKIESADVPKYQLASGDIVFARTGATTGKSFLVDEPPNAVFASYLIRLRLHGRELLPKFVSYFFQTAGYWKSVRDGSAGSAQGGFNASKLGALQIPLPPLPEQHRIVAILDAAFDHIATARANCEANLLNARAVFESYLQEAFNNKSWKTIQLQDACAEIFAGGDAPKENFSLEKSEKFTIPIFANAVKKNGLYGYTNFARVTKPSITISARGSGTGHTEIRFESFLPIVRLIVLIPNAAIINLEFLKYSIDNLEILRSGSAIPQLTVPMIKEYHIPLPTLSEQLEIISKLEIFCAETQRLESLYQRKLQALDDLKKSLLHQALSGLL